MPGAGSVSILESVAVKGLKKWFIKVRILPTSINLFLTNSTKTRLSSLSNSHEKENTTKLMKTVLCKMDKHASLQRSMSYT